MRDLLTLNYKIDDNIASLQCLSSVIELNLFSSFPLIFFLASDVKLSDMSTDEITYLLTVLCSSFTISRYVCSPCNFNITRSSSAMMSGRPENFFFEKRRKLSLYIN